MCLVIKRNGQALFFFSLYLITLPPILRRSVHIVEVMTDGFCKENWLKNGSKSWWWIFIGIPFFCSWDMAAHGIPIYMGIFFWQASEKKCTRARQEEIKRKSGGRNLNNKYQHEITNHLNTAAYDTNGVINPTKRQYSTNQQQSRLKRMGEWLKKRADVNKHAPFMRSGAQASSCKRT